MPRRRARTPPRSPGTLQSEEVALIQEFYDNYEKNRDKSKPVDEEARDEAYWDFYYNVIEKDWRDDPKYERFCFTPTPPKLVTPPGAHDEISSPQVTTNPPMSTPIASRPGSDQDTTVSIADNLQLKGQIIECFRMIDESAAIFDRTYDNLRRLSTGNTQAELEAALLKEMKKLQEYRWTIKAFMAMNDEIKNPQELQARKTQIEMTMAVHKNFKRRGVCSLVEVWPEGAPGGGAVDQPRIPTAEQLREEQQKQLRGLQQAIPQSLPQSIRQGLQETLRRSLEPHFKRQEQEQLGLQKQIDECFKKVDEGTAIFDALYDKLRHVSAGDPLKAKHEAALLKEIKKL